MTKPRNYTNRSNWTQAQIAIVERYIDDATRRRVYVRWDLHADEIGHPVSSIRTMAHHIRNKRRDGIARNLRQKLRALADKPPSYGQAPGPAYRGKLPAKKPARAIELDSHRISTTTAMLKLGAEMRDRIGAQGLTAGWFGDPPPGRSALDERRMGIVRPEPKPRGMHIPKKPTLATKVAP
jgi:hypothetical protein